MESGNPAQEEKLTGIELFAYDACMGIVIIAGWILALIRYCFQPSWIRAGEWSSRREFRQHSPRRRISWSEVGLGLVILAGFLSLFYFRPQPFG